MFELQLKQRGRASVDFMAHISRGGAKLREAVSEDINSAAGNIDTLPEDLDERNKQLETTLASSSAFRVQQLVGEWHARNHGIAARSAFEEIQEDIQADLDRLSQGPTAIETFDDFVAPDYWEGVNFHRTAGGWVGHPYMGFIHGEIIHRRMVDKLFPGGIFKQRLAIAALAPKQHYSRILDMGCSSGHFTQALAETYPDAEITGVELSLQMLEHAQRIANDHGWKWRLLQRAAEDTDLPDASFDLICSYILLHELPADAIKALFSEAFRLLEPGGDLLMSDVTRYADMNKLEQWQADRGAMYGGEPHWRSSAVLDLKQVVEEAGFVDVSAGGMNGMKYPYVVRGRKPN